MARKGGAGAGNGIDIGLLFSNLVLTVTLGLAVIGWIVAFVGQIAAEAQNRRQGVLWFNIFLQLFLILAAIYTIATNSVSAASLQISFFLAISIVFSVIGINQGIYSGQSSREAVTAGWFILAIVNIIWLLYFTAEEDTFIHGILNRFGNGALHGPGGAGRRNHVGNGGVARMGSSHEGNAYGAGGFVTSHQGGSGGYQPAFHSSAADLNPNGSKSNGTAAGAGSIRSGNTHPNAGVGGYGSRPDIVAASDHGRAASPTSTHKQSAPGTIDGAAGEPTPGYGYRARALYAYQANADDPTEISFSKGEVLDIVDNSGKWWQARKATGETGIVPSNYMQVL